MASMVYLFPYCTKLSDEPNDFVAITADRYARATARAGELFPVDAADGASVIR
jgi:hypothetical protein